MPLPNLSGYLRPLNAMWMLSLFGIITLVAGYYLLEVLDVLYVQYDAYYYSAVAETLLDTGSLQDGTVYPPEPVRTPQNGIVFLHAILIMLGLDDIDTRLRTLACINLVTMAAAAWMLVRLGEIMRLDSLTAQLLGTSVLMSFYLFAVMVQPINDSIALFLSVSALVLMLGEGNERRLPLLVLIAVLLPLFRISGVLVFVSMMVACVILGRWSDVRKQLLLVMIAAILPVLTMVLLSQDSGGVDQRLSSVAGGFGFDTVLGRLWTTISLSLPEAFLRTSWFTLRTTITSQPLAVTVSLLLLLSLAVQSVRAYRSNDLVSLVVCLSVWSLLAFFQLYHAQPTRYIILAGMLLPLVMVALPAERSVRQAMAVSYLGVVLLISVIGLQRSELPDDSASKRVFSENMKPLFEASPVALFSYFPRVTYFLMGQPSHSDIRSACSAGVDEKIIVVSPRQQLATYVNSYQRYIDNRPVELMPLRYSYRGYIVADEPLHYFRYQQVEVGAYLMHC